VLEHRKKRECEPADGATETRVAVLSGPWFVGPDQRNEHPLEGPRFQGGYDARWISRAFLKLLFRGSLARVNRGVAYEPWTRMSKRRLGGRGTNGSLGALGKDKSAI